MEHLMLHLHICSFYMSKGFFGSQCFFVSFFHGSVFKVADHWSRPTIICTYTYIHFFYSERKPVIVHLRWITHPVEDISPTLCGDTLVNCQHRKSQIVKMGDSMVWAWPASSTLCAIDGAPATITCLSTWSWLLILHCGNNVWKPKRSDLRLIFMSFCEYVYPANAKLFKAKYSRVVCIWWHQLEMYPPGLVSPNTSLT